MRTANTDDVFVDGLPGTPDNISVDERGIFWVGIAGIRDPEFEKLADKPFLRKLMGALPPSKLTPATRHAFVLGLDSEARVVYNLQDPDSEFSTTTGAVRQDDRLYVCSLGTDAIGVLDLP